MHITDQIRRFIVDELTHEDGHETITDLDSLLERGILDSLGLLKVLAFIEDEYKITVSDEHIVPEHFESIGAIASLVQSLSKRNSPR